MFSNLHTECEYFEEMFQLDANLAKYIILLNDLIKFRDVNGSIFFFGFRFGSVLGSVRFADLRTDTFFELICGLIYCALIVQKSANRSIYRIEANRKTRNQSNSLRTFKCNNWAKNRTQPNRKPRAEPKFYHINIEESTEPIQKQNESVRKLYFTTQFFLHFEFRFFHRFGFCSVRFSVRFGSQISEPLTCIFKVSEKSH